MKILILITTVLVSFSCSSEDKSFREKMRERLKERFMEKQNSKPAPDTNAKVEDKITTPGDYTLSFKHDNIDRYYKIHVPASYKGAATPMLINFHGGGGDMNIQADDKFYKLISKSNEAGFIVVFPNGYSKFKTGKLATWNAGKCCGAARDEKIDDIGFIKALVRKLKNQLNIDAKKIYASGMSNGGLISYSVACEMSDVFSGIASIAGTDNTLECSPSRPINILHIHAKDDDHVLFNGGAGKKAFRNPDTVTSFNSVPATISKWVKLNGCSETPKRVLDVKGAYCDQYTQCKEGVKVQLCVTETGGHSWPGGQKPRGGGEPSKAISANDVLWDFFSK